MCYNNKCDEEIIKNNFYMGVITMNTSNLRNIVLYKGGNTWNENEYHYEKYYEDFNSKCNCPLCGRRFNNDIESCIYCGYFIGDDIEDFSTECTIIPWNKDKNEFDYSMTYTADRDSIFEEMKNQ